MDMFLNTTLTTRNNYTKPTIQVLTYREEPKENAVLQIVMLFTHYMIAFPVFVLCWYAMLKFLKRKGHISERDAEELRNVKIAMPTFTRPTR